MPFLDSTPTDNEIILCGTSSNNPRSTIRNDECSSVVPVFCHFVGSLLRKEHYIAFLPGNHGDMQKIF